MSSIFPGHDLWRKWGECTSRLQGKDNINFCFYCSEPARSSTLVEVRSGCSTRTRCKVLRRRTCANHQLFSFTLSRLAISPFPRSNLYVRPRRGHVELFRHSLSCFSTSVLVPEEQPALSSTLACEGIQRGIPNRSRTTSRLGSH